MAPGDGADKITFLRKLLPAMFTCLTAKIQLNFMRINRMNLIKRIAETDYVRAAIEDKADLSAFKQKLSIRTILGISIIAFSYIIGWRLSALWGQYLFI